MPLILERSETQNVAKVTRLLLVCCGAHLEESYCKESNISDTNWLRDQNSVECMTSPANLHILKT